MSLMAERNKTRGLWLRGTTLYVIIIWKHTRATIGADTLTRRAQPVPPLNKLNSPTSDPEWLAHEAAYFTQDELLKSIY
jgi:hypothetical protein